MFKTLKSNVQNIGISDSSGDYDLVYYNADIINSKTTNSTKNSDDPLISFKESRSVPIINDARNYDFSIIRFQINGAGKNLPLMIPNIAIGANNPFIISNPSMARNCTVYTLGLYLDKVGSGKWYASRNIIFSPENLTYVQNNINILPRIPTTSQDLSNDYYFVYTYEHFVTLVNETLKSLVADLAVLAGTAMITYPPYMTYEPSSGLFSIYYDTSGYGLTTPPINESLKLFCNNNTYGLFSSFDSENVDPAFYTGIGGSMTNGTNDAVPGIKNENNYFDVYNKLNTNLWLPNSYAGFPTLATSYYKMTQNFVNTSSYWNPIQSIVFCSGQLPVKNEEISAPIVYGTSNDANSSISNSFSPIIADLAINMKRAEDYNNLIYYEPNGEYKMASMLGGSNGGITDIDIQVYFKNRLDNKLYPIRMFNYSSVSMKMLFRKKK